MRNQHRPSLGPNALRAAASGRNGNVIRASCGRSIPKIASMIGSESSSALIRARYGRHCSAAPLAWTSPRPLPRSEGQIRKRAEFGDGTKPGRAGTLREWPVERDMVRATEGRNFSGLPVFRPRKRVFRGLRGLSGVCRDLGTGSLKLERLRHAALRAAAAKAASVDPEGPRHGHERRHPVGVGRRQAEAEAARGLNPRSFHPRLRSGQ